MLYVKFKHAGKVLIVYFIEMYHSFSYIVSDPLNLSIRYTDSLFMFASVAKMMSCFRNRNLLQNDNMAVISVNY